MPPSFFMRWCIYQGWSVKQEQQPEREISLRGEVEDRIWRAMQNLWQGTLSIRFIQLSMVQTHTTWFMVGLFNLTPDFSQKKKCFGQCFHPRQLCRSAWKTWSSLGDFTDREIAVLACAMEELRVDFNIDAMKEVKVIQVDAWFEHHTALLWDDWELRNNGLVLNFPTTYRAGNREIQTDCLEILNLLKKRK